MIELLIQKLALKQKNWLKTFKTACEVGELEC